MEYINIINELKNKIYKPIYLLSGEEPYFIDIITEYIIENTLTDAEKGFNQTVIYATDDTKDSTIVEMALRYPMMSNYQVVVVKEAQNIKKFEDLTKYSENPLKSTILVINYKHKKIDKRTKFYKNVKSIGVAFDSEKLRDYKIPTWIEDFLKQRNYKISPKASSLLAEFLGTDLNKIVNELEKLIITLPEGNNTISPEHIEKNIGISKDYNSFELQNALGVKDVLKSNKIVDYFIKNPKNNPTIVTISILYAYFVKLMLFHQIKDKSDNKLIASKLKIIPFFVNDFKAAARNYSQAKLIQIMSLLREYNMKLLGVSNSSITDGELLRELVFKILH